MRISPFTGRMDDAQRVMSVQVAGETAEGHGASLLVLPGRSHKCANPSASNLQKIANEAGVSIIAEATDTFRFRPREELLGPFTQRFIAGNKATHNQVEQVTRGVAEGQRIVEIEQKSVAVLLCGENNILRNVRERNNEPQPRYPDLGWPLNYDVLANPTHSSMGQWNLLHKRFSFFSQSGRTALFCTNNKHSSWRTSLCVYHDGKLVVMGDLDGADELPAYRIEDAWRLVTIKVL